MTKVDLRRDVPTGWFLTGTRDQVPSAAVNVGRSGPTWVWVMPDQIGDLSRFTLLVLFITKLGPGESTNDGGGLMYTDGGN